MADWNKYILPLLFFTGSIGIGILVEHLVVTRLARRSLRTTWKGDEIIFRAFRGIILSWSVILGAYLAVHRAAFDSSIVTVADKILFSLTVFSVSVLFGKILIGLIRLKSPQADRSPSTSIVSNIIRIAVYVVGALVILQRFGISITPLLTALGVGALAVALALQDTLSNLFSGIQVIASRQVRIGDYVKLDSGEEGYVSDITWRNTIIRALSNNYVIVPNSKIASAIVTNYYLPEKEMSVLVEMGVSYDSDLPKVERVTVEAAKEVMKKTTGAVPDSDPFIRFHTFSESAIKFSVIMRAKEFTDQYLIKHEFVKCVMDRYRENQIEIPFPMRSVILKNAEGK